MRMKSVLRCVCLLAAAGVVSAADWESAPGQAGGLVAMTLAAGISGEAAAAPNFSLPDVRKPGGAKVSLRGFRGKVVLLDFWSTLCGPCRAATPAIIELHKKYAAQGLVVLAIDVQEPADKVRRYVAEKGIPYRVLLDSQGAVAGKYGIEAIPCFFVIDAEGRLVWRRVGLKREEMEPQIRKALGLQP